MTFEIVYTTITSKAPQLAPKNTHIIHEWLSKGYDVQKDILPAIEKATSHGALTIRSFKYFDGFIQSQNEKRLKAQIVVPQADQDAVRAKAIAYAIRKLGRCMPTDERWLVAYEAAHGAVL